MVVDKIVYAVSVVDGDQIVRNPSTRIKPWSLCQRQVFNAYRELEAKALACNCNAYGSTIGLYDSIWRTMISNKCEDGTSPPSPDYGVCFDEWKQAVVNGDTAMNDPKLLEIDRLVVGNVNYVPSALRRRDT